MSLPSASKRLTPDVVHVDVPVHPRAHGGLGDHEQRRLNKELADLRRDRQRLVPALHGRRLAAAQDAEPALEHRLERGLAGGEDVVSDAEEGEIVRDQPFQELDGLGDLGHWHGRRIGLELRNLAGDARRHRAPILDAGAHIGEHLVDRSDDLGALALVVDALDMDVDEALARRSRGRGRDALEGGQPPGRVALDGKHGMHDEADVDAEIGELGEDGIDQERHVVVDDLEHRVGAEPRESKLLPIHRPWRGDAYLGRARLALREERPGIRRQSGKVPRVVTHEVFGRRIGENARR